MTLIKYYASDCFELNSSLMNVNCFYIVYFSVKSFYPHFRSFETYSCIISYCAAFYLSIFSHDAVRMLATDLYTWMAGSAEKLRQSGRHIGPVKKPS